ncbi:MAG: 1-(5-phosphoribosyl)-5-[(5-phosphoribosylamino)methylideneamino] imidazole-4-carboxamide isomerase [Deltaproteobacteria bacterium]|nr:1-(5-phosphoribosyl)-5-[(5-phosphoribosylamino)methylideneamino] imidazole-4-carboxamide isomerase [Deltaproteobacteria bacterium]
MLLIPAIDLKDGQCVRLVQGRFEDKTVYGTDPAAMARRWADLGAKLIHLIDLDGSLGESEPNRQAIMAIRREVKIPLQLGGGLKTMDNLAAWFDLGLDRLILGTAVCENPQLVEKASARWPGRVAAALDASGRTLKVWGWCRDGGRDLLETAALLKNLGVSLIIHTDVDRDGTKAGPNLEMATKVRQSSGLPTIVSGGISGEGDLRAIKNVGGFFGVISGKALYEGNLDFASGLALLAQKGTPSDSPEGSPTLLPQNDSETLSPTDLAQEDSPEPRFSAALAGTNRPGGQRS